MKYKKLNGTSQQYRKYEIGGTRIENIHGVWMWMCENLGPEVSHNLMGDNVSFLRGLFGEPSFRYRGERLFTCYVIDVEDSHIIIFTHKEDGTSYECPTNTSPESIIAFLQWFNQQHLQAQEK